jgi:hypothetical protein
LTSAAVILKRSSDFIWEIIDAFEPFLQAIRIIHSRRSIKERVSESDVGCVTTNAKEQQSEI